MEGAKKLADEGAYDELGRAYGLLSDLVRALPTALAVIDRGGLVTETNAAAEKLMGRPSSELLWSSFDSWFPEGPSYDQLREHAAAQTTGQLDVTCTGALRRFPAQLSFALSDDGTRLVCLLQDLTSRKEAELRDRHADKMRLAGQMTAGVAHEVNTPLQYIGSYLEFLAETDGASDPQTVDERASAWKAVRAGLERIEGVVSALGEFSHPGSGDAVPTDLDRVVGNVVRLARGQTKRILQVEVELCDDAVVQGRAGPIHQALLNLVQNAAYAVRERHGEGAAGTVHLRTTCSADAVVIEVRDNGTGIASEARNTLFEPFVTTKPAGQGTGQGLAIVRHIMAEHGGDVEVSDGIDGGAGFRLRFPRAPVTTG